MVEERRQLKSALASPDRNKPNPITVGEEDKPVRPRIIDQYISESTKRLNEKKALLPMDRTLQSPRKP